MAKLTREFEREQKQSLLKQRKTFEKAVVDLKAEHKRAIGKLKESSRRGIVQKQRISEERSRQEKIFFEQEFSRLRSAYQTSLAQIKQAYGQQKLGTDELRASIEDYLDAGKAQFDGLAESTRVQLREQQTWLLQQFPAMLVESMGKLNDSRRDETVDADRLVIEISKRDEQVGQAMEKIKELEARLASRQGRTIWKRMRRDSAPEPYKEEDEPSDPQQEILDMIREIAREREHMGPARNTAGRDRVPEFGDSFGSRMSTKLVH